jgi:hypothetical protein
MIISSGSMSSAAIVLSAFLRSSLFVVAMTDSRIPPSAFTADERCVGGRKPDSALAG